VGAATRETEGRPPLAVVTREGDPHGAIAVAVMMEGIAPERGAVPAVALAALVEARLLVRGIEATAVGGWGGWRARILVESPAEAARVVESIREAMLTPVGDEAGLAAVARKVAALARRPLPDRALVELADCTGEAFGTGSDLVPDAAELESWRQAALGLGRVAFASAGEPALADATGRALARGPAWPRAGTPRSPPASDGQTVVYEGSGQIPPGGARIVVTARTAAPEQAVAAAPSLGDPHGPLVSRLAALDAPALVRSVVAAAHGGGGCVAMTLDVAARDLAYDSAARIATAAALARQELSVELTELTPPAGLGLELATRASDPREAAERAAWWALAGRRAGDDEPRTTLIVGIAATRDSPPGASGSGLRGDVLRSEIDRATMAWHAPAVETRTRVERGQGEAWVLLASPCGALAEASGDAGAGAAVAMTAAAQANLRAGDAQIEPFVESDGVGVLAHGPPRAGESPQGHARRLADLAARAFAADPLDAERISQARTLLLAHAGGVESRAMATLGDALAPGHPSWVEPFGTRFGLASASEEAIVLRAATLRAGPLRVAVLASTDAAQAEAAARAVDRWIARRPHEVRACPPFTTPAAPRAGTYAVDVPPGALSEALLALPLAASDDVAATWMAAALDGPTGLLARALGGTAGAPAGSPLARNWSAGVLGMPRSPALVIRLSAADALLDAAVAQTRALLDRLRQGALREEDRAAAATTLARSTLAASLDARARVIALWRGDAASPPSPSLDTLRAFAASSLRDEALVIVAARPPRREPLH